jgi:hypothetical protein
MPRGVYDRSAKPRATNGFHTNGNGHGHDAYSSPAPPKVSERWKDEEIKAVAAQWVLLSLEFPLESPVKLLNQAQHKALPSDRHHNITTIHANKFLVKEFAAQWHARLKAVPAEEESLPQILTIEVERKLTFAEMLSQMDEASLSALLAAKVAERQTSLNLILSKIAHNLGANDLPPVQIFHPHATVFAPPVPKVKRVIIVGPLPDQIQLIKQQVEEAAMPVEIRFLDKEKKIHYPRADFIIVTRHTHHAIWEKAKATLTSDRVFFLTGGTSEVVQKVRDLCARQ